MLKISDFSRIAQVSARTLRYYDDLGLLKPQVIDPATGYRYYVIEQLARLNRILALKDLGFGLDQIVAMLNAQITPDRMRDYLRQQEREIEKRIRADTERLHRVRNRLKQIEHEEDGILIDVVVKSTPPQPAVGNRMIVPTQADLMFFTNHMLIEVYRWLKSAGLPHTSTQLILYRGEEYSEANIDTEVVVVLPALPVNPPSLPHSAMRFFELPAAVHLVTTTYHGQLQEASRTVRDLLRWCEQSGYQSVHGLTLLREVHLFSQVDFVRPIPAHGTIEFQLPVEPVHL